MRRRSSSISRSVGRASAAALLGALVATLALPGCDRAANREPAFVPPSDTASASMLDMRQEPTVRAERILAEARPGDVGSALALIRVLKDRSQAAFLLEPATEEPLGYRVAENKDLSSEDRAMDRAMAVCALERVGGHFALCDLLLALQDKSPVVVNHAARALVRLGSRAGVPALLDHVEGRAFRDGKDLTSPAFAGETANRILEEISGESFGFNADAGEAAKAAAGARWRAWWAAVQASGAPLRLEGKPYEAGVDAATDRRIRFYVDMLGQMQTLFHEQVRRALSRAGKPIIPVLRWGVEQGTQRDNPTLLAGIAQVIGDVAPPDNRHPDFWLMADELLRAKSGAVRARAAKAMAKRDPAEAVRALGPALKDADPSVRVAAIQTLGVIGTEDALAIVRAFDPGAEREVVRARLLALFEATKGGEASEEVLAMLDAPDIPSRNAAHGVLSKVSGATVAFDAVGSADGRKAAIESYRRALKDLPRR